VDTTKTLIERLRAQLGGASNYRLQKHLGISKAAIIRYVHERGGMSYDIGLRVGSELGLQPDYVLLCLAAEREQSPEIKTRWERLAHQASGQTARPSTTRRRAAKVAAVLLAAGIPALFAPSPVEARAGLTTSSVYYGKGRMKGRRRFTFPHERDRFKRRHRPRRDTTREAPAANPITC
jgi:hypothetical protein